MLDERDIGSLSGYGARSKGSQQPWKAQVLIARQQDFSARALYDGEENGVYNQGQRWLDGK